MPKEQRFSDTEIVWLVAWNVAAGYWDRVNLSSAEAKQLMLDFAKQFLGDPLEGVTASRVRMQQTLMAMRRGSFEEIQADAPFHPHAQKNLLCFLTAFQSTREPGFATAWRQTFPQDRQVQPVRHPAVRVIENDGESQETALEIVGAPDRETRIAAEHWYLRYRFGRNWTFGMHMSTVPNASGDRFSVHHITVSDGSNKRIYFCVRDSRVSAVASSSVANPPHTRADTKELTDYLANASKLREVKLVWLLGWNIAAGQWGRIGLSPEEGKKYLADVLDKLRGDTTDLSKRSAEQLQHDLMALGNGTFEEIQQEAPFSPFAQRNMGLLLSACREGGSSRFAHVWDTIFHPGWEAERMPEYPIRVIEASGDSEQHALEILSASRPQSRTAAEFWYLFYSFAEGWRWERHETLGEESGPQFSVHHIRLASNDTRRVFFRLSW